MGRTTITRPTRSDLWQQIRANGLLPDSFLTFLQSLSLVDQSPAGSTRGQRSRA
jgi:hypothetical protein